MFFRSLLTKELLTKEYTELFYVGSCLRFKHHMEKWCHMKKCTYPKHFKKVPIQTPTKTKWKCGDCDHNFTKKRTTITGIVRTFTQNKFPIRNLSQSSAHD